MTQPSGTFGLYLDLLEKCLLNAIHDDDLDLSRGEMEMHEASGKLYATRGVPASEKGKQEGGIWPSRAHTMIGAPRMRNLRYCVEEALREGIPGDLVETGVWRGGASIYMRGILKAHGVTDRRVWVADSFAGLPPADFARYPKESKVPFHLLGDLAVSLEQVRENFSRYGLLDDQVHFLKGWFKDTLPSAPIETLAVMRLDGDLYESTRDALVNLYPKLSPGGFAIVDDYNAVPECNAAVHDFRAEHGVAEPIVPIGPVGAWWRKRVGYAATLSGAIFTTFMSFSVAEMA